MGICPQRISHVANGCRKRYLNASHAALHVRRIIGQMCCN
jgi:hypothetical protein